MGMLDWFRLRTPKLDQSRVSDALIRETTDYVVKMTDPRLALIGDYRERLAEAVHGTLQFIGTARTTMAPSREVTQGAWAQDPCLKAVFVQPEELVEVFSRSKELRDFLSRTRGVEEVHALLAMDLEEHKRFGMEVHGGMMVRDVPQTTLSFSNHRIRLFGHNRQELWRAAARRMLDELAVIALGRMQTEQELRKELENSRSLLTARLGVFERRGTGVASFLGGAGQATESDESRRLLEQLEENERQLAGIGAATDTLDRQLDYLYEVLAAPQLHMTVERRKVRLDAMNVVVNGGSADDANSIEFNVVQLTREPETLHAMVPVVVNRDVIAEVPRMRLDEAERLI